MGISINSLITPSFFVIEKNLDELENAVSHHFAVPQELQETLYRINFLESEGVITSEIAISLKNNLSQTKKAETILSEFISNEIRNKRLVPKAKDILLKRGGGAKGIEQTILFIYTCHLQKQQALPSINAQHYQGEAYEYSPKDLFKEMQKYEKIMSRQYLEDWLKHLPSLDQETSIKVQNLRFSLSSSHPKKDLLDLLLHLKKKETNEIHKICLEEFCVMIEKEPESTCVLLASRLFKSFAFYQQLLQKVQALDPSSANLDPSFKKAYRLMNCRLQDLFKNGTGVEGLKTSYSLIFGQIAKSMQKIAKVAERSIVFKGASQEETTVASHVEGALKEKKKHYTLERLSHRLVEDESTVTEKNHKSSLAKTHHAFSVYNWLQEEKEPSPPHVRQVVQVMLRAMPNEVISVDNQQKETILSASKALKLPVTFISTNANTKMWEKIARSSYPSMQIALPTDDVPLEKSVTSGLPVSIPPLDTEKLKAKWAFENGRKVIVIKSDEGDSPWPTILAKEFEREPISLVVLTENEEFAYQLQTKVAPTTMLPIHVYKSISDLEKKEILALSDLIIDKARHDDSTLLFEACSIGKQVLLDKIKPSLFSQGIYGVFISLFNSVLSLLGFKNEISEFVAQKKLLASRKLGAIAETKSEFRSLFKTMLSQEAEVVSTTSNFKEFVQTIPKALEEKTPSLILNIFSGYAK